MLVEASDYFICQTSAVNQESGTDVNQLIHSTPRIDQQLYL